MELQILMTHIEALIFASEKPLTEIELLELINKILEKNSFEKINLEKFQNLLETIVEKYRTNFYAFEIRQSGGGYQFLTKPEFYSSVTLINEEKFIKKLSNAALETLSIIAYKQPITKNEIEIIRGVNCDYVVQKLLEKDLIIIKGRNENLPGKPLLYSTSKTFMDYFGLNSNDDLPKIKEIILNESIEPLIMKSLETNSHEASPNNN